MLPLLSGGCLFQHASQSDNSTLPNQLSPAEQRSGWRLLFNGHTLNGWRSFNMPGPPQQGWVVEDGCLRLLPHGGGGDIVTVDEFDDFELQWDWRIAAKGNNGVKYLVAEARRAGIGHEYQMVDDSTMPKPKHQTASFYDVLPPTPLGKSKPPGQWNHSRIVIRGNHVEHWLNGARVLEYEMGSPELKAAVARSKFRDVPGFGEKIQGRILLTDHQDETWFRNIRIRELPAPQPQTNRDRETSRRLVRGVGTNGCHSWHSQNPSRIPRLTPPTGRERVRPVRSPDTASRGSGRV